MVGCRASHAFTGSKIDGRQFANVKDCLMRNSVIIHYLHWVFDWLIDWLIGWLIVWLIDWLVDWLIDQLGRLMSLSFLHKAIVGHSGLCYPVNVRNEMWAVDWVNNVMDRDQTRVHMGWPDSCQNKEWGGCFWPIIKNATVIDSHTLTISVDANEESLGSPSWRCEKKTCRISSEKRSSGGWKIPVLIPIFCPTPVGRNLGLTRESATASCVVDSAGTGTIDRLWVIL